MTTCRQLIDVFHMKFTFHVGLLRRPCVDLACGWGRGGGGGVGGGGGM